MKSDLERARDMLETWLEETPLYAGDAPRAEHYRQRREALRAAIAAIDAKFECATRDATPINMVLPCPRCGVLHIDEPAEGWDNPPHRSHLCGACGCIWRPADVPTNGVPGTATVGKADNWNTGDTSAATIATRDAEIERLRAENDKLMKMTVPEWYYLGDDQSSDQCRFGVYEVIDEDWNWDNPFVPGEDHIVHITTAMRGPDIWAHLHVFTDDEKDARGDDEPYSIDEYPTAAAAEAARDARDALSNKDAPPQEVEIESNPTPMLIPEAIAARDAEIEMLRVCIEQAAGWFDGYAAEHYAKAKTAPDSREQHGREVKGKLNRERANQLRTAISNKDAG